ncbi:MAG: hypothetical protein AAF645_02010 [Myxococcota bacterium]
MRRFLPAIVLGLLCASSVAEASPWTLRQGELAFVAAYDYQFARREFLDDNTSSQNFPLRGRFSASSITFGLRAGFTDRLEFEVRLPFRLVSYTSDPVILLLDPTSEPAGDFFQENVIDLSRTRRGLGDVTLMGRYNLIRWPVALALEGVLKTPTGYEGPEGTFGENPESAQDFETNAGRFARPENVSDDVVLGDGQVDIALNMLFGVSFPTRTFIRADIGYNLRVGAGDQVQGAFKVGQAIGQRLLFFAEMRFAHTVTQGELIGVSVAAVDPNLPAADYDGLTNLNLREVRLERDFVNVGAGGIVRLSDATELNLAYSRTIFGRNTAAINAFFAGVGVRVDLLAGSRGAPEAAEPAPEPEVDEVVYEEDAAYDEADGTPPAEPTSVDAAPEEPAPVEAVPEPPVEAPPANADGLATPFENAEEAL